jgi:shikimate dehydrogenase
MINPLSGKTKVLGIIGDPIEHSLSPLMHNAAFAQMGADYCYLPFRVRKEELGKAIEGMRALNIRGLNVTIPHKVAVIPFLDKLDPLAEKIGAVNTIVNDDGKLTGYNTDANGFLQSLIEGGIEPASKNIVLLGAGGAARATAFILAKRNANLVILNRKLELDWAEDLAQSISRISEKEVKALKLDEENLGRVLDKADILINATSVGMSPDSDKTPVPAKLLKSGMIIFDIVYNPIKTRLLTEAEAAGAKTISGIDMLIWQGAASVEKWTGLKEPIELMREVIIKALQRNEN